MHANLADVLATAGLKQRLVDDCRALVEQQLADKSGLGATVLKAAYSTVTTLAPGYYESRIERMVPAFVTRLQPFWSDFQSSGGHAAFGDFLAARGPQVADALLAVTDERAAVSQRTVVTKLYATVRGSASEHIQAALPAVGALIEKYAA